MSVATRTPAAVGFGRLAIRTLASGLLIATIVDGAEADPGKPTPTEPLSVYCLAGCSDPPRPERVLTMRPLPTGPLPLPRSRDDIILSGIVCGPEPYGGCRALSYEGWRYWRDPEPYRAVIEVYHRN